MVRQSFWLACAVIGAGSASLATSFAPSPAYAGSVTLLSLNFDGSIVDAAGHSFTTVGNPVIDTSTSAAGSGSLRIDAGAANYLSFGPSADFDLGANDFSISLSMKVMSPINQGSSLQYASGLSQWGNYGSESYQVDIELTNGTATPRFNFLDEAGYHNMLGAPVSLGIWHAILVQRVDDTVSLYVDGALENSFTITGSLVTPLNAMWIGESECDGNASCWPHDTTFYIDELNLVVNVPGPEMGWIFGGAAMALLFFRRRTYSL